MAMLIKARARRPLERGSVSAGWMPHGCGGIHPGNAPCVALQIGEHRLILTEMEWRSLNEAQEKLMRERPAYA